MLQQRKLKEAKGFTIIEVLIVLAIAGLIMLIVFLAVPALQRNQRNTSRRSDVSRLGTAAANFLTNSNGANPATTGDVGTITSDAGTLAQFTGLTATGNAAAPAVACAATPATNTFVICAGAVTFTTPLANVVVLGTGVKCSGSTAFAAGSSRQMAIVYTVETAGGNAYACQDI